ncbi:MAG: alpha/beta fold hydrolase [Microbacteriaceae bacterium]|nr:alpha/beta fold hydrolase [Microbacteriaceae bacterium]
MSSRHPLRRVRVLGAAAALAALALLAGCYYGGNPFGPVQPAVEDPVPTPKPVETTDGPFGAFYDQQVDWRPCEDGFECATITAPLDWEDEGDDRTVELAAIRHPATGPHRIGSLFVNPGGPGASGYDFVAGGVDWFLSRSVIDAYDVVGWDPRGIGRSSGVTCFTDPEDISEFLYYVPEADYRTDPDAWVAEQLALGKKYADACEANTGDVLEFIDTLSTVRDLDLLRAVVGDEELHYLGYSYGTAIGAVYADEFPERVGRVVLDGVMDREAPLADLNVSQQAGFELALTHFVEACPSFDGCPLTGDPDRDLPRIHQRIVDFQDQPVADRSSEAAAGRVMNGTTLRLAIIQALYSDTLWPDLAAMLGQVLQSQPSTDIAWQLADMYNDFTPGVGYNSTLQDALFAVYCVDYPVDTDPAVLADTQERLEQAAPTLTLDLPVYPDPVCSEWPYSYRGGQHGQLSGKGAKPVLIVSTTGDPATPYEEGVKLADDLESGVLVSFDGEGHTAYSAYGDQCVVDAVDGYLVDGTVPEDGTWCEGF